MRLLRANFLHLKKICPVFMCMSEDPYVYALVCVCDLEGQQRALGPEQLELQVTVNCLTEWPHPLSCVSITMFWFFKVIVLLLLWNECFKNNLSCFWGCRLKCDREVMTCSGHLSPQHWVRGFPWERKGNFFLR